MQSRARASEPMCIEDVLQEDLVIHTVRAISRVGKVTLLPDSPQLLEDVRIGLQDHHTGVQVT